MRVKSAKCKSVFFIIFTYALHTRFSDKKEHGAPEEYFQHFL